MSEVIETVEHQQWQFHPSVKPSAGYVFGTDATNRSTAKDFGLRFASNLANPYTEIKIGPFVGLVNLPGTDGGLIVARSKPKQFAGKTMDYAAMFDFCMGDATVAQRMENCFFVWTDEDQIEVDKDENFTDLLILAFVNELHSLCLRHLRQRAVRRTETLVGKVKGRILVAPQIRQNLAVNRPDRMDCSFFEQTRDCRENQILRSALEVAASWMRKMGRDHANLRDKMQFCRNALDGVSIRRIHPREFLGIRYAGAFQHYRQPHGLAKAVLFSLGINPEDRSAAAQTERVYPFVLCTFELFERFTEAVLRRQFKAEQLWVGYRNQNLADGGYSVRPDMIVIANDGTPFIIDAKYRVNDGDNGDAYKSVAYAYHFGVIDKTNSLLSENNYDPEANIDKRKSVLLYPNLVVQGDQNYKIDFNGHTDVGFKRLIKMTIDCPMKS
ncbi:MAG: hypothetical protein ORO03_02575 [Alphaproteobacteria bacterium]|nr:hypothetical protein [Alphaproteobacteria bacterium]